MTQDNGMDASLVWQEMKDELEQVKTERDALAAHVERITGALREVQRIELDGHHFIRTEWVKTLLGGTPTTNLARLKVQWQAEEMETLYGITEDGDSGKAIREVMFDRSKKLRRQAEGDDQ